MVTRQPQEEIVQSSKIEWPTTCGAQQQARPLGPHEASDLPHPGGYDRAAAPRKAPGRLHRLEAPPLPELHRHQGPAALCRLAAQTPTGLSCGVAGTFQVTLDKVEEPDPTADTKQIT